jgi:Tol biopolymer transport system component/imidazolonepropionase-like amidohydrolase
MISKRLASWRARPLAPLALAATIALAQQPRPHAELPLQPSETIEFSVHEGTWMSLDVSPDGRTIVFDLLGDLYILPIEGGQARRIVGGLSFEAQPKFSPDGRSIAFISDRDGGYNIWTCKPDGSDLKPVTQGRHKVFGSPSWTPNGSFLLAVDRDRTRPGLVMIHKDGGTGFPIHIPDITPNIRQSGAPVATAPAPRFSGPVTSPDGRYFYFASTAGRGILPIGQIVRYDRRTGQAMTVTNAQGSGLRPVLSPDGAQLVYGTRFDGQTGLRVRDLRTGQERWLAYPVTRDEQDSLAPTRDMLPGYAFTPDGKSVVVAIDGKIHRVALETGQAKLTPFTAEVRAEVAPRLYYKHRVEDGPLVHSRITRWPKLSPDGKRVAFSTMNKLWVADLPAGKPRRLTTQAEAGEYMPAWSPDGAYIVYVRWLNGAGDLWRVRSDGSQPPQRLTTLASFYMNPMFAQDGSKIAFVMGDAAEHLYADLPRDDGEELTGVHPGSAYQIAWIPAGGGEPAIVCPASDRGPGIFFENAEISPHFGKDPDRLYWAVNSELHSSRLDGSEQRVEVIVKDARDLKISPDGNHIFAEVLHQAYLVHDFADVGRQVLTISVRDAGKGSIPAESVSAEGGDYLQWAADGRSVTWALGTKFYLRGLSDARIQTAETVVDVPRHRPQGTVALRGASIVTMKGDEILAPGDILITDNRIVALGRQGMIAIPAGAKVIDVSGKYIIPGFVDAHAHMRPPSDVYNTQVWTHMANLAYGVTTARDPQSHTNDLFAYIDMLETGEMLGPREFTTGPGVLTRYMEDSAGAVRTFVRRYKDYYRTTQLKEYVAGDRMTRQWIAAACREFEITPTTEGSSDMMLDLSQIADGYSGSEHNFPVFPIYQDVVQFVARTRTFYTPTFLVSYGAPKGEDYYFETMNPHEDRKLRTFIPHERLDNLVRRRPQWAHPDEYGIRQIAKGVADIIHASGRACLGSHGQMQGLGVHWDLWSLQSGGLTPHETLRAATLYGAEAIGYDQDLGSLEPGKFADLLVLDRDPLADIHNSASIRYVMRNGEMYEADTLNEVWPVRKPLGPMWWQGTDPKH